MRHVFCEKKLHFFCTNGFNDIIIWMFAWAMFFMNLDNLQAWITSQKRF